MSYYPGMTFYAPDYKEADRYDQYMLGDYILVAPVIENTLVETVPADWLSHDGKPGIKVEYFNNIDLSGDPVIVATEKKIDFDWGRGKPHPQLGEDYFSVRFTGDITIKGSKDVILEVRSDDGCRLYVDDNLVIDSWVPKAASSVFSSVTLEAGKTYSIKLEYFEEQYDACCRLGYLFASEDGLSRERTVFISEGEWINTINGESVYGPQTISVQCEINRMPIFIKKGAVIPLADEMLTVKDKDWSHITLELFPSTRQKGHTVLFEDDTVSTDYEKGLYRTTSLKTSFENGKAVLRIGAAQGDFKGDRAFSDREWTIRVHRPEGWGQLKKVYLNDVELEFNTIERDPDAMPLIIKAEQWMVKYTK